MCMQLRGSLVSCRPSLRCVVPLLTTHATTLRRRAARRALDSKQPSARPELEDAFRRIGPLVSEERCGRRSAVRQAALAHAHAGEARTELAIQQSKLVSLMARYFSGAAPLARKTTLS